MENMVASSVVQEGVSKMSSYISGKLEEKASRRHMMARLKTALSQLEYALERTAKWPIPYVSLLRDRKVLKDAYMEGRNLLNKHKLQLEEDREEIRQRITGSYMLEWISRARNLPISSVFGLSKEEYLSSSVVRYFESRADLADKFVTKVESGCPFLHVNFGYQVERQLFERKTLVYGMVKGSEIRIINMWPVCLEGRGMEVVMRYIYEDCKVPSTSLEVVELWLRLTEGTNIIGSTIRCLQFVSDALKLPASKFKCLVEPMIGETNLLSSFYDISDIRAAQLLYSEAEDSLTKFSTSLRPDPICCANNFVLSESSHGFPEPVILIHFNCYLSAPEYMSHSSTDVFGTNAPLLELSFLFMPHFLGPGPQDIVVKFEGKEECISGGSMQLMEELLRSTAFGHLACHPEPAKYAMFWCSPHGGAAIYLNNSKPEMACRKPTTVRRSGRVAAKRKR